jgi:DNA-binding transcriptional regulator GbsR (MarR family)
MAKTLGAQAASDLVADALGRLMEFWGFKRTMGRVWATLYLVPEPLPAAELCSRLGISAGAASMTLTDLERWGVVHRLFRPGERREFFVAETNLWKMIARVYAERERREIDRLVEALEQALSSLGAALAARAEGTERLRFAQTRVRRLLTLARLGRTILDGMLSTGRADLERLRDEDLERDEDDDRVPGSDS